MATPVVNDAHFTDIRGPLPTIGSPAASFNPGANAGPLMGGPPKYVGVKGKRPAAKGLTNKRLPMNNI